MVKDSSTTNSNKINTRFQHFFTSCPVLIFPATVSFTLPLSRWVKCSNKLRFLYFSSSGNLKTSQREMSKKSIFPSSIRRCVIFFASLNFIPNLSGESLTPKRNSEPHFSLMALTISNSNRDRLLRFPPYSSVLLLISLKNIQEPKKNLIKISLNGTVYLTVLVQYINYQTPLIPRVLTKSHLGICQKWYMLRVLMIS